MSNTKEEREALAFARGYQEALRDIYEAYMYGSTEAVKEWLRNNLNFKVCPEFDST